MINVMYIVNNQGGGAAHSFIDMLQPIRQYINPVVIIVKNAIITERIREMGITYYEFPLKNGYGKEGVYSEKDKNEYLVNNFEIAKDLSAIIKRHQIQLIHTNSSVCNVGQFAALMNQIPHIWHVRELLLEHYNYVFWDNDIKKDLFQTADKIIAISDCVKRIYLEKYELDLARIYNGLAIERFYMPLTQEEKYFNSFLLAGEIIESKGQWDAIRAVEILVSKGYKDVELYIVGDGNYKYVWFLKQYIKQRELKNNVHIYSYQKDLREFRKRCSYAITSSRFEALGRVTIEAMLSGNIVIGANTGGTLELIGAEQERGYLYEQGDVDSLVKVMTYAINDTEETKMLKREKAQQFVINNFNNTIYANSLNTLYQNVLLEYNNDKSEECLRKLEERYYTAKKGIVRETYSENTMEHKYEKMFKICHKWLSIRQDGNFLEKYFIENGIRKIAIYGMGFLGQRLYTELEGGGVDVAYAIDQEPEGIDRVIKCIRPDDNFEKVDAIVVTAMVENKKIEELIRKKCSFKLINITEILNWQEFDR